MTRQEVGFTRTTVIVTLLLSLVLLLATGPLKHEANSAEIIKVGAVMPLTGVFAFAGVHLDAGLRDALMMANDAGGINGKEIQYIVEDGEYNLAKAKAAFRRIVESHNPLIMYGESTALGKAMSNEIKNRYKVLYGPGRSRKLTRLCSLELTRLMRSHFRFDFGLESSSF